jgi:hypothetical protein
VIRAHCVRARVAAGREAAARSGMDAACYGVKDHLCVCVCCNLDYGCLGLLIVLEFRQLEVCGVHVCIVFQTGIERLAAGGTTLKSTAKPVTRHDR